MEAENIQTKHIAEIVGSLMSAVIPWNIVQSFRLSGLCLVRDDDVLRCQVRPDLATRLMHPIQVTVPGFDGVDEDAEDDLEEMVFAEECTELRYDLNELSGPKQESRFSLVFSS
jgi:hypothetical protein